MIVCAPPWGRDVYTSSLREAVEACLEAARADIRPVAA